MHAFIQQVFMIKPFQPSTILNAKDRMGYKPDDLCLPNKNLIIMGKTESNE
jgi:hypothetical protein